MPRKKKEETQVLTVIKKGETPEISTVITRYANYCLLDDDIVLFDLHSKFDNEEYFFINECRHNYLPGSKMVLSINLVLPK